jgi:UDP-glucuronate 4-epimerase
MNILVTGGAGFVGSHLCEALVEQGDRVVALDNFDPCYPRERKLQNVVRLRDHARFNLVEGDLNVSESLIEVLAGGSFDVVVHLAAKAGIRASMRNPSAYIETNLGGTANLLEAMTRTGCRRLVFGSSSSVYGNNPGRPSCEEDQVTPVSVYAMTKKSGEELCSVYNATQNFSVLCLRFFTVYGPRQRPEMAIHKFTRLLLNNEPIPLFGDGSMERDYTYVDDITRGVTSAIDFVTKHEGFEVVNVGSGMPPVTLNDLVARLGWLSKIEPKVEYRPVPGGDVDRTCADINKARGLFGYQPQVDLSEGLGRFLDWYRADAAGGTMPASYGTEADTATKAS